jgi:hypothetical protein
MSNWINGHNWKENISCPLSLADLERWQSELDSIVGVEADGSKRWRFIWGQSPEAFVWNRYTDEWMPRYPAGFELDFVSNPSTGIIERKRKWIGVPRFFAEAVVPKVHRNEKAERAGVDPDGDVFTERRVVGADYMTMFCVTQHHQKMKDGWRLCCLRRLQKGQTCYGHYRPPDEADIQQLREDYEARVTSKCSRPDEKPTAADKSFFYHAWMLDQMRDARKRSEEMDASRRHILKTLVHWPGTSFDSKKNRYSIPTLN